MTVSTTHVRSGPYAGNGVSTAFPVDFEFYAPADLVVIERDTVTGAETVKALTTHYTVSGGAGSTGTVTAVAPPPSGVSWTIIRQTARTQTTAFVDADSLPAKSLEDGFDRSVMLAQEAADRATRSIRLPDSDNAGTATILPASQARAGRALVFDPQGNVGVSSDLYVDQTAAAADSAAAALASEQAAANSAGAAANSAGAAAGSAGAASSSAGAAASSASAASNSATSAANSATQADLNASAAGAAAPAARLSWDTGTSAADPGAGKVRVNNATLASVTALHISETDAAGANLAAVFAAWTASTNAVKGRLRIAHRLNLLVWIEADVTAATDNGAWWTLSLSSPTGSGGFAAADVVAVSVARAGDAGINGSGPIWAGTSGGSANAQTLTPTPPLAALTGNPSFEFLAGFSLTGAGTLNVSGTGALSLRKADGTAAGAGDVLSGTKYVVTLVSGQWRMSASGSITAQQSGTTIGSRGKINFIAGYGATVAVADNSGSNSIDVTIALNVITARYWRLYYSGNSYSSPWAYLHELELFTSTDATGPDQTTGMTATASTATAGFGLASNAIDNVTTTAWTSSGASVVGEWLYVDLVSALAVRSMTFHVNGGTPPSQIQFQYSSNASTWTTLSTIGIANVLTKQTFTGLQ